MKGEIKVVIGQAVIVIVLVTVIVIIVQKVKAIALEIVLASNKEHNNRRKDRNIRKDKEFLVYSFNC